MKKLLTIFLFVGIVTVAEAYNTSLTLKEALDILKAQNLEIKAAKLEIKSAYQDESTVSGLNWGKLNFIQDASRSNDAGNVFGFKLTSREASFGDFGFIDFLSPPPGTTNILNVQPTDLNYPGYRNFFQSKLHYEVPLFTGFALSNYASIKAAMTKMKTLEKDQVQSEKIYQLRKSYYDMALLESSIKHLKKILSNIETLEDMTQNMIEVGYAKKVDLLEVKAKKGNVERLLLQMNSNEKLLYHYISFLLNQNVNHIIIPKSEIAIPLYSDKDIIKNNLDIKKASTGLEIRQNMIGVSKASYYPTLGAFAEVSTADNTFMTNINNHKAYTIGARLTWNIFNGGIDKAKIEKAKIDHLKMQSQVDLARHGIALKIAKIRTEIQSVDDEINSLEKELELADAIYENYEGRYKEKLASMSDVIIKQSAQIQKILQLQMAKNKRNERIFALEKLANGEK